MFSATKNTKIEKKIPPFLKPRANPNDTRKTLVLDMDNTLILPESEKKFFCDFSIQTSSGGTRYITKRPYLDEFLQAMRDHFEIVIWTAAPQEYADQILDRLDPNHSIFSHRLYDTSCTFFEENGSFAMFTKHLNLIGRDMSNTILVDDMAENFFFNLENGIPIAGLYSKENFFDDDVLSTLIPLLKQLSKSKNVTKDLVFIRSKISPKHLIDSCKQKSEQNLNIMMQSRHFYKK